MNIRALLFFCFAAATVNELLYKLQDMAQRGHSAAKRHAATIDDSYRKAKKKAQEYLKVISDKTKENISKGRQAVEKKIADYRKKKEEANEEKQVL